MNGLNGSTFVPCLDTGLPKLGTLTISSLYVRVLSSIIISHNYRGLSVGGSR